MTNSTNACDLSPTAVDLDAKLYFASYYLITPIYFFMGTFGNGVLLAAFYKQSKTEKAYAYQLLVNLSKMFEVITFTFFVLPYKWGSGAEKRGSEWYMRNYFLMWYAAKVSVPLVNSFITSSLLLSLSMSADRVLALGKPFVYRNLKHSRHQTAAGLLCFCLGLSTSVFDCFRFNVINDTDIDAIGDQKFKIIVNEKYLATLAAVFFSQLRTLIRISGVLGLIVLNVVMISIYRRRMKKVTQMTASAQKEQQVKMSDRTLLLLTVWQSALTFLANVGGISYYIAAYVDPSFTMCQGTIVASLADGAVQIATGVDFFVVLTINKKCRQLVANVLPFMRLSASDQLASQEPQGASQMHSNVTTRRL